MSERDVTDGSLEPRCGRFRRASRTCGAALALVGCVAVLPQPAPSADLSTIRLPPGFAIELFARDLGYARFMAFDPHGTLLVSVPRAGRVLALPDDDRNGRADAHVSVVEGLDLPHGLAFLDGQLYVAETGRVLRFDYDPATRKVRGVPTIIVPDLPPRGGHWTRTIAFGDDRRLYVAVGSSCNSCQEADGRRAAVYRYQADGSGSVPFATGLRNAVGLTFRPGTRDLWATVNGRDWLGEDRPAEYITRLEEGGFYGWPHCHWTAAELVPDPDHGGGDRCRTVERPSLLYQAHAAPLGLVFYTGSQFPPDYRGNLLVALHGSWNRAAPVGYKVIRVRLDGATPVAEDFATGWLAGSRSWGRPVDLVVAPDGAVFLSDDGFGAVYRITYRDPGNA